MVVFLDSLLILLVVISDSRLVVNFDDLSYCQKNIRNSKLLPFLASSVNLASTFGTYNGLAISSLLHIPQESILLLNIFSFVLFTINFVYVVLHSFTFFPVWLSMN